MTSPIYKKIGNTGTDKDFTNIKGFAAWLKTQDLIALDVMVYAYVYNDQSLTDWSGEIVPKTHSAKNFAIIQPAPGLGVNELLPSGAMVYGNAGIELLGQISSGSATHATIRPGISLRGFRIRITGGPGNDTTAYQSLYLGKSAFFPTMNRLPEVRFCRIQCEFTGALARAVGTGESATGGLVTDNLIIHTTGNGLTCALNYGTQFERNTVVRLDTAKGYPSTTGIDSTLRDNVFIGCGSTPAIGLPSAANAKIVNNYTDTAMTGNTTGFTVVTAGTLVETVPGDYRLKSDSVAIGKASAAAIKTFDMLNVYRGSVPDVGAFQRVAQPLPPVPVGTITGQTISDQTITFTGTIANEVLSGVASISKGGTQVGTEQSVTITGTTFSVTFAFIPGGNYDAPVIKFSNDGGTGAASGGAAPFTIANPVIPVPVITKQYVVGRKLTLIGMVSNAPQTGTVAIPVAATPNGAVAQGATAVTLDPATGTFSVTLKELPYGNYDVPVVKFSNGAGTSAAATGGAAFTMAVPSAPAEPGVNAVFVGTGQQFATLKDFGTWLNTRDLIANNEIVKAYVINDQSMETSALTGTYYTAPSGADATHYCVISPAPGMGVNEIHKNDPLNYGVAGIELSMGAASNMIIGDGVVLEGFRITVSADPTTANRNTVEIFNGNRTSKTESGIVRRNRFRSMVEDSTNAVVYTGQSSTPGQILDNYFEHPSGSCPSISFSYGTHARNTFVRRGTAKDKPAIYYRGSVGAPTIRNNIMLGCGPVPVKPSSTLSGVVFTSNLVDTALTTATTGITVAAATSIVADPASDLRPKAGGVAIGTASSHAVSTLDIIGQNRGPAPDVGAWQLTPFTPVPVATVTSQDVDGMRVTISGTVTNGPTSGSASMAADATTPDGASSIGLTDVTISNGTFSLVWDNVSPGNYKAPIITFTNSGGTGAAAANAAAVTIISIEGNPSSSTVLDGGAGGGNTTPPTVEISASSLVGRVLTLNGTVDLQGDATGKLEVFFDSVPLGTTLGPFTPTIVGNAWQYTGTPALYKYQARVVATANGWPTVASQNFTVLRATGTIQLPLK